MERKIKEQEREKNSHLEKTFLLKKETEDLKAKFAESDNYKVMYEELVERIKDRQ